MTMVIVPTTGPNDSTARDPDRAAVLVAYTLLGAAINGFALEVVGLDRGRHLKAAAGFFPYCHRN
jgi:hypothetical protein